MTKRFRRYGEQRTYDWQWKHDFGEQALTVPMATFPRSCGGSDDGFEVVKEGKLLSDTGLI